MEKFQMNGNKLVLRQFTETTFDQFLWLGISINYFKKYLTLNSHSFITHSQSAFIKLNSTQTYLHNVIEYAIDNVFNNEINGICMVNISTRLITKYF